VGQGRVEGGTGSSPRRSGDVGWRVVGEWARFDRAWGTRHGRGRDGCREGTDLTRAARESARGRAGKPTNGADGAVPLGREGEGERASGVRCRHVGLSCQRTRVCARAASWVERAERSRRGGGWAFLSFSFIPEFLILFLLFSSFEFKFKHAPNSDPNNSNMCI
jgi:hypothetical protein